MCSQARLTRDVRFDGLFFVLVHSTGIFCRNICRVKAPLEKNVSYAHSAQQAIEKGFRPCLRCRPDSAPHSWAWQGTQTTLVRAMKLLSLCDGNSIEHTAQRLGISSRYLHKMFIDGISISPKHYQLYQQILAAKSLLQQTNLNVQDIAISVGFSGERQLQAHCKTLLKLSPSEIRKQVSKQLNTEIEEDMSVFLSYRPPYDWQQIKNFWSYRLIENNESFDGDTFTKILNIHGHSVSVKLSHKPEKHGFYLYFSPLFSRYALSIIAVAKRMLDLEAEPQFINASLKKAGLPDSMLNAGMRIPGVASVFEAGCRAILGQQVSVKAAINKLNTLQNQLCGDKASAFVSAERVAQSNLDFIAMPALRKQCLRSFAEYCARHKLDQTEVYSLDSEALLTIKGIGPWTINYIELRALAHTDKWLDNDLIIKKQIDALKAQGVVLDNKTASPWRSYLTLNLWSHYDQ